MFRAHDRQKTGRSARFALEPLEERVELSGVGAAAHDTAAIDRLNDRLQSRVEQIDAHIQHRTARLDAGYEAALGRAATQLADGHAAAAHAGPAHATARIDRSDNRLVRSVNQSINALTQQVTHQAAGLGVRYIRYEPAIADVAGAVVQDFRNGATALGGTLKDEVRTIRDTARAAIGPARAAVAQLRVAGTRRSRRPRRTMIASTVPSQRRWRSNQDRFSSTLSAYDRTMSALQSELAALPPGPVMTTHTGAATARAVTSRVATATARVPGAHPAINGLGTGTVTFTGLPGADATSGSGGGLGNGVEATAGVGFNLGSGVTTITGVGTETTGVGATVTAGNGATSTIGLLVMGTAPEGDSYGPSPTLIPADI